MDKDYTKREVDIFMREIKEQLDAILSQTTKTNGRVSSLENWRAYSTGAIAVIVIVVIPVLGWVLHEIVKLQTK